AALALCARTGAELDKTCSEIRSLNAECATWTCDVSLQEPVRELVANVTWKFNRIDVLVNNAGVMTRPVPITQLDVKKWDYTIAVNLRGPFLVTQAVLPIMIKQKSGSVINVSSMIAAAATLISPRTRLRNGGWRDLRKPLRWKSGRALSVSIPLIRVMLPRN